MKQFKDVILGLFGALLVAGIVIMGDQLTRANEALEIAEKQIEENTCCDNDCHCVGAMEVIHVVSPVSITTPEAIKPTTLQAATTPQAIEPKKKKKTDAQRVAEIYTKEELDLIYRCVQCEAGVYDKRWSKYSAKEYELSQRLVTDVIMNMVDDEKYPNTIAGVIKNHGRFSVYPDEMRRCKVVTKQIKKAVNNELLKHSNKKVMYFRSKHYHGFGTPYKTYAGSYFSTR